MNDEEIIAMQDELEATKVELETRSATVSEMEQAIAARDNEIAALKQSVAGATASYRALVARSNPGIVEELITGDTVEAIDRSLESARALTDRVREELQSEAQSAKVPAGAPQRTPPDLSALSPREKIQYAVGRKS